MDDTIVKQKKKRGRKPKGGKIINKELTIVNDTNYKPSIIMHLKCSTDLISDDIKDNMIEYTPELSKVEPSNAYDDNFTNVDNMNHIIFNAHQLKQNSLVPEKHNCSDKQFQEKEHIHNISIDDYKKIIHRINNKFYNNRDVIKSDCFWCCHEFNTPSIHIPKNYLDSKYNVYGYFCSLECSAAFLFNENINTSEKFERYTMLNMVYSDITKNNNVKPAPSPYYLLSKFCGNMSIEEFRDIYTTNHNINYVDKPNSLNIDFPELYMQMNDDSSVHNYDASAGSGFKIKKSTKKNKKCLDTYFNV